VTLDLPCLVVGGLGLADHAERQPGGKGAGTTGDAGALEERAAVEGLGEHPREAAAQSRLKAAFAKDERRLQADFLVSNMVRLLGQTLVCL